MMTGHSSLERWAILCEIREYPYTKRISQLKIISTKKLYLEIAGYISELNRSKEIISASKDFLNGEKRCSLYWAYDL